MGTDSTVYQIVLVFHVLAAVVWVGGLVFMAAVVVPVARRRPDDQRRILLDEAGRQFRAVGWSALTVSVATGSYMLYHWGATWASLLDLSFFRGPHTRILGYKLLLVALMLAVSALHDWWLGPRATAADDPDEAERLRTLSSWLGRTTGLLAIGVVLLAIFVARPWL